MHKGKTTANAYLFFNGNCREAMTFYEKALSGTLEIMNYEGSPMDVPEDQKDKVMHSTLKFGDAVLMASDSMPGQAVSGGSNMSISIASNNEQEAEKFFNNLAEGGQVVMPFDKTFWNAKFGMLTDRFGINWMVNCNL